MEVVGVVDLILQTMAVEVVEVRQLYLNQL
jgi:hypothetical protein